MGFSLNLYCPELTRISAKKTAAEGIERTEK